MRATIERLKRDGKASVVVCDIPLLFETGAGLEWIDRTVVVYAPREVQRKRLIERNGLDPIEADRRIAAQLSTEEKARRADDVIDNTGDLSSTMLQVDRLWKEWTLKCGSH